MVGGLLALILSRNLFRSFPPIIALQALSAVLFLWARITFGRRSFHMMANATDGGLVTSGPYRYIRHPIYTAICVFALAGVAGHMSWGTALCGGWILTCAVIRISCEESLVTARYPAYTQYKATTSRMIPYVY